MSALRTAYSALPVARSRYERVVDVPDFILRGLLALVGERPRRGEHQAQGDRRVGISGTELSGDVRDNAL
jgi:hypothetical protein